MIKTLDDELDLWHQDFPVCPFCGYVLDDCPEELFADFRDEELVEAICGNCGSPFEITLHVDYEYTTEAGHHEAERQREREERFKKAIAEMEQMEKR